ncbi:hypothetical protein EG68_02621 [Paragonimus skrjabini miyazakii]|uniref:Uncharacterized protein n=1 Tax=Paragonimus skrjabini miyazakii TaxID=59628 RepID=A0A8S9Z487_9TREM|nr:hypothetical protein EG68_02621 [Paragonimus skrjabini miyazakii]
MTTMRVILVVCLAVTLLAVYTDARPDEASRQRLIESAINLRETIHKVMTNLRMKARQRLEAWLEKDGLGEKLSEVLQILINRLNERLSKYLN